MLAHLLAARIASSSRLDSIGLVDRSIHGPPWRAVSYQLLLTSYTLPDRIQCVVAANNGGSHNNALVLVVKVSVPSSSPLARGHRVILGNGENSIRNFRQNQERWAVVTATQMPDFRSH